MIKKIAPYNQPFKNFREKALSSPTQSLGSSAKKIITYLNRQQQKAFYEK
jgi:hypothetical protein